MRRASSVISVFVALLLSSHLYAASPQNLPACDAQLMTRNGNELTIALDKLAGRFNQQLGGAHSAFSSLRLQSLGGNKVKISVKKNGNDISISGPLKPVHSGAIKLHANKIVRNGNHDKGLMDLFGKDLADYAHFGKTQSLSAKGNNLFIHPDPLLNVSGPVTGLSLAGSTLKLKFASQPCR